MASEAVPATQQETIGLLTNKPTVASESLNANIALAIALLQNFGRDWVWGIWSQKEWNFYFESTPQDFGLRGEWGPQFVYGSLAAIAATIISASACKAAGKEIPVKDMMASLVGTMAAIIPWDAGYNLGMSIGKSNGWSQVNSALFASTFTGIFEGVTQYSAILLTNFITKKLCNAEERRKFSENPKQYLTEMFAQEEVIQFFKGLGYSVTIGAVPGAVWQLVFAACGVAGISAVPTGLLIALAVGVCNFGVAKIEEKKLISRAYEAVRSCGLFKPVPKTVESDLEGHTIETSTDIEEAVVVVPNLTALAHGN